MSATIEAVYERPEELLQTLIRFDTTNPPGNEAECVNYINGLLTRAGFETTCLAKASNRPNLITRLKGQGRVPPLLLYGHVDVVPTADQAWTHPPFEGKIIDGYVWGRGALDMKGGVAMMLAALLQAKAERLTPAGDVVLAILCDEEELGDYGAKYLVENHAEQFEGIRYAIGEFGGSRYFMGRQKFYPIQVAEKQICVLRATVRGRGGHGSMPLPDSAVVKLAQLLQLLTRHRLPVHVTSAARQMLTSATSALPFPTSLAVRLLLNPAATDSVLNLLGDMGRVFDPLLHNTVNIAEVRGDANKVVLELGGLLLPGYGPDDLMAELRHLIGDEVELELVRYDPGPSEPDMGLFNTLADILREADPGSVPFPQLSPAITDARFFSQLGIQTYGFTPMKLPPDFDFIGTIHAADERIPLDAVRFGTEAIYQVLQRYEG